MIQYIDKAAVVAEIESKRKYAQSLGDNAINSSMQQFYDGMKQGCVDTLSFIDTLEVKEEEEEPVSEDLDIESMIESYKQRLISQANGVKNSPLIDMCLASYKHGVNETLDTLNLSNVQRTTKNWKEPVSEDLEEYINELSKQFPEVSFAKLSRIAVRVAKWQKEQFEKNRLAHCDALTEEQAQIESDFVTQHLKKNSRTPTFVDAIEYGMRLQKEKMMAKAVDAHVNYAWSSLSFGGFDWSKTGLDIGDKCKLIIIKED